MLFIDICTYVFSAQFQHVFREIPTVWYDIDNKTVISFLKQYPKEILNFGSLCLICDKHHNPIPKIFFLESWNNSSLENQCKNLRCLNQVSWHLIIPTLLHSNLKRHPRENLKKRKNFRLRNMAIRVVEFSREGYKIRKVFA